MNTTDTTYNARIDRLRGHVAADLSRLLTSESAALVESATKLADGLGEMLDHLAPRRTDELRAALTTLVDAVVGAITEQTPGELFVNLREVLARDTEGHAVTVLHDALDITEALDGRHADADAVWLWCTDDDVLWSATTHSRSTIPPALPGGICP